MERTCKNCMYEYGRLLPNPCGECSFVDNDRFIPKDDEVKKMLKSEIIEFEQLSGENAEITSISRIGGFLDGYHKAMEKQQWIPCADKLPEKTDTYIATLDYGKLGLGVGQRYYLGGPLGWNDDCVIAWMPMPEPYKEETDELDTM